jgi:hypothetical protein
MRGVKLRMSTAPDAPEAMLPDPNIIRFIKQGWIKCEEFSIAAVQDKSKANAFNKAVASVQIFWFFSQLVGRLTSTIATSPLEWFTLAYVVCAFFMYGFWWHKPFDVQTPLLIYPDLSLSAEQMLEIRSSLPGYTTNRSKRKSLIHLLGLMGQEECIREEGRNKLWMDQAWLDQVGEIAMVLSTVLFGCCHLCGWNYPFPTTLETYLWRSASISCVCIPLFMISVGRLEHSALALSARFSNCTFLVLFPLYVLVRLFLLFEVFFALRSAPPEIYKPVPWAQYIPHI